MFFYVIINSPDQDILPRKADFENDLPSSQVEGILIW